MATKKPKLPKFAKYPKQPKATASVQTWKNYDNKVKAIKAENDKKAAEYKKKLSAYEAEIRNREAIKSRAAKAKAALSGLR